MVYERASSTAPRATGKLKRGAPCGRRALGVLVAAALAAAACGGGGGSGASTSGPQAGITVTVPAEVAEATAAALGSRPGEGINAAGGNLVAGTPCPETAGAGEQTTTIAVVGPDIDRLNEVGLGALVFDPVERIFDSYIGQINSFGGIGGNCFDFKFFEYGFTDIESELAAICAQIPAEQPLVLFAFAILEVIAGCTTIAAQIPTIGLYSQFPEAFFSQTGGLLLVDHGSLEFLLENGLRTAAGAGVLTPEHRVGLLYSGDAAAPSLQGAFERVSTELGLQVVAAAAVPEGLYGTAAVVVEDQFRNAGGELFSPEEAAFEAAVSALPPELGGLMSGIRQHSLATATAMRDAGVNTVVASAEWDAVRNLMRAAEVVGWQPRWITNDSQFALIVLTDAPAEQGANLVQVSSRRAADDPIDGLDRGCLSLRNTGFPSDPFDHRFHTDAWSLLTAVCDYLDVVFSAVSRVQGPLDRGSFMAALGTTEYRTAHGQSLRFADGDPFGSDSFRVLGADPTCVLNDWGCMRPLTGWFESVSSRIATETGGSVEG